VESRATKPGWYPDPQGRFDQRYFDGLQWKSAVTIKGHRYIDSTFAESQVDGRPLRRPRRMATASPVVAGVGAVIGWMPFGYALGIAAAVAAVVLAIFGLRISQRNDGYGRGLCIAGLALVPIALGASSVGLSLSRIVDRDVTYFNDPGPVELVVQSCSTDGSRSTLRGTIRNADDKVHDYRIIVELDNGLTKPTPTVTIEGLSPGATAPFVASAPQIGVRVKCHINDVLGPAALDHHT
jgi:hypothetical protein